MTGSGLFAYMRMGRAGRPLPFERRVRLWLTVLSFPALLLLGVLVWSWCSSRVMTAAAVAGLALLWWIAASCFLDFLIRPLNTLSNVVAALREDDYSFRARGARPDDAMGGLALEINTLAASLQSQRVAAMDALTLVERVLAAMPSPVLALDEAGKLQLQNAAARAVFELGSHHLGQPAEALGLASLRDLADQAVYIAPGRVTPWSVRRAGFRLHGLPHTLLVLSDVSAALRREERVAFQRLIRVLSHEITNSLTPIKSIAGTLRTRLATSLPSDSQAQDLARGLGVIEDRATSLHRFLEAYQSLARMPEPALRPTPLEPLLRQVTALETRVEPLMTPSLDVTVLCDPDQVQQALINLLRNAADAALEQEDEPPAIQISWELLDTAVTVAISDNGLGLLSSDNLFVPFYTTKPQGSGIGLALAQQVASAHGGSVTLRNAASKRGCVAEFTLPLVPVIAASRPV